MKVINLFAGPGAGKSTTAAGLFYQMKRMGLSVELVTEYAKDMTWEKRYNVMSDQLYMFAKQRRKQLRVQDHAIDYVVTDSPLILGLVYTPHEYPKSFTELVIDMWNQFDNRNFFIARDKEYVPTGRSQTELQARELDDDLWVLLEKHRIDFEKVTGDGDAVYNILTRMGIEPWECV